MFAINEFNLSPGVYKHHEGGLYVVTELVTHQETPLGMQRLADPLVCYRELAPTAQTVYARPLSQFRGQFTPDAVHNGEQVIRP